MPRCSETVRSSDWGKCMWLCAEATGHDLRMRAWLAQLQRRRWLARQSRSKRTERSEVKRDRSAAVSQSYAKQNCQWHAASSLSCPKAEQHNCQHSTAHKADPQSESGIANVMPNKTQRSVRPAEWCGASCLPEVNAKSTRRRDGITRDVNSRLRCLKCLNCECSCINSGC